MSVLSSRRESQGPLLLQPSLSWLPSHSWKHPPHFTPQWKKRTASPWSYQSQGLWLALPWLDLAGWQDTTGCRLQVTHLRPGAGEQRVLPKGARKPPNGPVSRNYYCQTNTCRPISIVSVAITRFHFLESMQTKSSINIKTIFSKKACHKVGIKQVMFGLYNHKY